MIVTVIMTVIMIMIMTDLRGLRPWLRAPRVKRRAEIASLMVIVTGTVSQSQDSLDIFLTQSSLDISSVLFRTLSGHTSPLKAVTVKMFSGNDNPESQKLELEITLKFIQTIFL